MATVGVIFPVCFFFSCFSLSPPWQWPFVNFRRAVPPGPKKRRSQKESRALAHLSLASHPPGCISPVRKKQKKSKRKGNPDLTRSCSLLDHCLAFLDGRMSTPGGRPPYTHMHKSF